MSVNIRQYMLRFPTSRGCGYVKPCDWDESVRLAVLTMNDPKPARRGKAGAEQDDEAFLAEIAQAGISVEDLLRGLGYTK